MEIEMLTHLVCAWIAALFATDISVAQLRVIDGEGHTFSVTISEDSRYPHLPSNLEIVCVAGCNDPVHFEEAFPDEPLGLFRSGGEENIVYVTSSSGSGYQIRAYKFNDKGIVKVLSQSASATPKLVAFGDQEAVELFIRDYSKSDFQYIRKIFILSNGKFSEDSGDGAGN